MKEDMQRLQEIAKEWMEIASSPAMEERKRLWKACRDLKSERPMIRFDAYFLEGYIAEEQLVCQDTQLRDIEKMMLGMIRQYKEVGDDIVLNDYFRIPWKIDATSMGVECTKQHTADQQGKESVGYAFEHPIKEPEDMEKLLERTFSVDKEATLGFKDKVEEAFGGVLPVKVGNTDYFMEDFGYNICTGRNYCGITYELFKLIGFETMGYWMYDEPDCIHTLMEYLTRDRIKYFRYIEEEQLLDFNTDHQFAGSVSYGFCSDLPQVGTDRPAKLEDVWSWVEAQETIVLSPSMYKEYVAPYIGRLGRLFGMNHYGCCERHDDRYDIITEELPKIRCFMAAKWNDIFRLGEQCSGKHVLVKKPAPEFLSGVTPMWDKFEAEMRDTYQATNGGKNLEIIFGDLYDINKEWGRLTEAVKLTYRILKL